MGKFSEEQVNELRAYPLCHQLQQLRWWSNLSQRAFAREIQCTQATLSRWEQGKSVPDGRVLARIIQYFGLPNDFFIDAEIQRVKLIQKCQEEKHRGTNDCDDPQD